MRNSFIRITFTTSQQVYIYKAIQFYPEFNSDELKFLRNKIETKKDKAEIILHLKTYYNSNIFLKLSDMDFLSHNGKNPEWVTFIIRTNNGYEKKFDLDLPKYRYYTGKPSYCVNLG